MDNGKYEAFKVLVGLGHALYALCL
ncbi:hypothetical protein MED222_05995 [Vibrio sp. MED222]|nr:hypothetical protein MED222_05995 [Vibrio sp. MED222]